MHLAGEVQRGLHADRLLDRAGVLASANDLAAATAAVVPAIVGLRRGLARVLGRPIGQSGSGPTLWALYPSAEDAGPARPSWTRRSKAGTLPTVGSGRYDHAAALRPVVTPNDRPATTRMEDEHDARAS
jgi:hypothetical protein